VAEDKYTELAGDSAEEADDAKACLASLEKEKGGLKKQVEELKAEKQRMLQSDAEKTKQLMERRAELVKEVQDLQSKNSDLSQEHTSNVKELEQLKKDKESQDTMVLELLKEKIALKVEIVDVKEENTTMKKREAADYLHFKTRFRELIQKERLKVNIPQKRGPKAGSNGPRQKAATTVDDLIEKAGMGHLLAGNGLVPVPGGDRTASTAGGDQMAVSSAGGGTAAPGSGVDHPYCLEQ